MSVVDGTDDETEENTPEEDQKDNNKKNLNNSIKKIPALIIQVYRKIDLMDI